MATETPAAAVAAPTYSESQKQEAVEMTCQCGQISLLLPYAPQRVLECHCSICFRYGALWAYYPRGKVLVTAAMGPLRPTSTIAGASAGVTEAGRGDDDCKANLVSVSTADMEGRGASTRKYIRESERMGFLEFHFCSKCGCVTHWWGVERGDGEEKMGVNVRMLGAERLRAVKRRVYKGPD